MGNILVMTPHAAIEEEKIKVEETLLTKLERLSNTSNPTSPFFQEMMFRLTFEILFLSFKNQKPLFTNEYQKFIAGIFIEKSLAFIEKTFKNFNDALELYDRQNGQKIRSGLQYLIDEFKEKEEVYQRLKPILDVESVKDLEEYIKDTLGIPVFDFAPAVEIDLNTIPASHFWWFYVYSEDDEIDLL